MMLDLLVTVPFEFVPNQEASVVEIAGSFNNWTKVCMIQHGRQWRVSLNMEPGAHQYKYIVDDKWEHDEGKQTIDDNMGGLNNLINVDQLFDQEDIDVKDRKMGFIKLSITEMIRSGKKWDKWEQLEHPIEHELYGDVLLSVQFFPSEDNPVQNKDLKTDTKGTKPEGSIHLGVIKGRSLIFKEANINYYPLRKFCDNRPNPYVKVTLGNQTAKSPAIYNQPNPEWKYKVSLDVLKDSPEEVLIEVFDQNTKKERKEAVETAFAKADTEGTGKLTRDQLKVVLGELIESGHYTAFITDKKMLDNNDTMRMFVEIADRDGDKLINLNELLIVMHLGEEKLDIKEMFTKLVKAADKDGNGVITSKELRFMIVTAGFEGEDGASELVTEAMSGIPDDKKLKIEEVVNFFIYGPNKTDLKEEVKQMFRMFDTNEDGFISKKELLENIKIIHDIGLVDEDYMIANMVMAESDEDKDGQLSYEEFCNSI